MLLQDETYETDKVDSWKLKKKRNAMNNNLIAVANFGALARKKICCLRTIPFWH